MTKADEDDADKGAGKGEKKRDVPEAGAESVEVRAVVDRVEDGGIAVLSLEGYKATLDVPLAHLPEGTSDGAHLRLTFGGEPSASALTKASLDRAARSSAEDRVRKMQERLERLGGTADKKDFKL